MAKTSTEIFTDKVALIYEYNKKSPLFVRMANREVDNNNLERAIEILNNGLKLYPDYSVAHLLLGKALMLVGNYSEALKSVKTGSDLIHSKKTYDYYLKEIEIVKKQRSLFQTTRRTAFMNEEAPEKPEPDLFGSPKTPEIETQKLTERNKYETDFSIDERLEQIANRISSARPPELREESSQADSSFDSFSGEGMIVSETLAKIYIAQGEYREALHVYEKLKKKDPKKTNYYDQKINELNKELES